MPAGVVNLDALIERQDFEAGGEVPTVGQMEKIFLSNLESKQVFGSSLRKPYFQRATSMWTPEKVAAMVSSFLTQDLVPAVILWRSPSGLFFVIDGAHRLSCLLAWVHDDYGMGDFSTKFFSGDYSVQRAKNAMRAAELVEAAAGGKYQNIIQRHHAHDATEPEKAKARHLLNCSLMIQWVPPGDAKKAENSFFKINEQGVPLDGTELMSLYSRDCPNSIAARAINQFGTGNPHWRRFSGDTKKTVEDAAKQIHSAMFKPLWEGNTIQTPMLPIAGRSFITDSLSRVVDTVNITNGIEINPKKIKSKVDVEQIIPPDTDGSKTINCLNNTKGVISRIIGFEGENKSLDLYPLVYFYSANGKHMPTSYLAFVELMRDLDNKDAFKSFTLIRKEFEEFLVEHKSVLNQVSRKSRGQIKAVHEVKEFLQSVIKLLMEKKTQDEVAEILHTSSGYDFAKPNIVLTTKKKSASPDAKSRMYISLALEKAIRCSICGARLLDTSINFDHKEDQKYGGLSHSQNLQATHHYCNSAKDVLITMFDANKDMVKASA
jgi:hypothetical protein